MNRLHRLASCSWGPLLCVAAVTGAAPALAADKAGSAASEARYQRDAAACLSKGYKGARNECLQGQGTTSGSVAGGGIYRELVTREGVVVPAASASAASQ